MDAIRAASAGRFRCHARTWAAAALLGSAYSDAPRSRKGSSRGGVLARCAAIRAQQTMTAAADARSMVQARRLRLAVRQLSLAVIAGAAGAVAASGFAAAGVVVVLGATALVFSATSTVRSELCGVADVSGVTVNPPAGTAIDPV